MPSPYLNPTQFAPVRPMSSRGVLPAVLSSLLVVILTACQSAPGGQASFRRVEISDRVPANGQIVLANFGGNAAADILLMGRQPGRLAWFENPAWTLHQIPLIADTLQGVAAYSPPRRADNGAAVPASLALNGRFSQPGSGTRQQLVWLQNPEQTVSAATSQSAPDAMPEATWTSSLIGDNVAPGALLWADMTGTGRQILVTLPALQAYTLPRRLSRPWGMMPLAQDPLPITRMRVFDWDLDGRDDLLVAGAAGLDIMALASRGLFVDDFTVLSSEPGDMATSAGFMDVGVGQAGQPLQRFVATLAADARQLIVFRPDPEAGPSWRREIIDDSLVSAAVMEVADLNRDSVDEIIVGDANGVTVFYYQAEQQRWRRYSVDGGIAIADIQIRDLTGNGFPDIVTAPAETGPVMLFQNRGN